MLSAVRATANRRRSRMAKGRTRAHAHFAVIGRRCRRYRSWRAGRTLGYGGLLTLFSGWGHSHGAISGAVRCLACVSTGAGECGALKRLSAARRGVGHQPWGLVRGTADWTWITKRTPRTPMWT